MEIEDMQKMIKKTYVRVKWYKPKNIFFALTHFGELIRYATIGLKFVFICHLNPDELKELRRRQR